ncbi:hypothetical protein BDV98DRAFT_368273 [Pterulicium gracile]|uniref:Uncharacterized protein n=1 Tax=Pterulicium gracile TaxID=1884261 RepID=A0A5C3QBJ6_9AGAR|nr:hypothetical protein BDV98DRAFT_368273 [Pterula gracilis]
MWDQSGSTCELRTVGQKYGLIPQRLDRNRRNGTKWSAAPPADDINRVYQGHKLDYPQPSLTCLILGLTPKRSPHGPPYRRLQPFRPSSSTISSTSGLFRHIRNRLPSHARPPQNGKTFISQRRVTICVLPNQWHSPPHPISNHLDATDFVNPQKRGRTPGSRIAHGLFALKMHKNAGLSLASAYGLDIRPRE